MRRWLFAIFILGLSFAIWRALRPEPSRRSSPPEASERASPPPSPPPSFEPQPPHEELKPTLEKDTPTIDRRSRIRSAIAEALEGRGRPASEPELDRMTAGQRELARVTWEAGPF